jgi:hypothetical protein
MRVRQGMLQMSVAATALLVLAATSHAAEDAVPASGGIREQLEITLPEGWSVYDQTEAVTGKPSAVGIVIFSAQPLVSEGARTPDGPTMAKMDLGELPSFFVERSKADKGMKCAKLSRSTVYDLATTVNQDPSIATTGRRLFGSLEPGHTDVQIGGCRGVRWVFKAHEKDPERHRVVDVRAVSDGKTLYLFSLRNKGVHYAANLPAFEAALASARFVATK